MKKPVLNKEFIKHNCCVIVPTYNNRNTIKTVIEDILNYTDRIIVVNDGSTDDTGQILDRFPNLDVISYDQNMGKGFALRRGFIHAYNKGCRYAITIDSDGQHLPSNLNRFIEALDKTPGSIIIGARNMEQDGIPRKSSFGNKFSNFWFRFETGNRLPDTQSGYRLYPLEHVALTEYVTKRFEFEIEVLVRASWAGIHVCCIPVDVIYQSDDERVSHFRPFKDFSRISVLNTVLVTIAIVYIKPRDFFRKFSLKRIIEGIKKNGILNNDSDLKIVLSVMFGLFMGIVPIWGYQLITAIALSYLFRLNKLVVIASANISIPPCIPFILYFSYKTGGFFVTNPGTASIISLTDISKLQSNLLQYIIGSLVFGFLVAAAGGLLTFILLTLYPRYKESNQE